MARTRGNAIRLMYVLAAMWLFAVGWLSSRAYNQTLDDFAQTAARHVDGVRRDVDDVARAGRESTTFLVNDAVAETLAQGSGAEFALQRHFLAYVNAHADVFQLRLLSAQGRERLRVERGADGSVAVAEELQDKRDRYYFQRARTLAAGEVYVSPIDFNMEYGRVEEPARLTLRFAAPVRRDGALDAVLVLNVDGAVLLERAQRSLGDSVGTVMMVHDDGVLVSTPNASPRWWHSRTLDDERVSAALIPWLESREAEASLHDSGLLAARAVAGDTQIVMMASEDEVIAAEVGSFAPLLGGSVASGLLWVMAFFALRRHERVASQLQRERALRNKLAAREARLEKTQERLVASARLAALTESAATLAHELRNPLGAIVTSAGMLRSEEGLGDESRELMGIVLRECERLERAVTGFLELARRPAPRPESVDLDATTRELVSLARHEPALADSIEIEVEEAEGQVPRVLADPDEIRQVLWNILRNASEATRCAGGNNIRVRVRATTLDDAPAAMLEVQDEGPGPPDGADPPRGGLGLIVAAGIAAQSGGRFELVAREDAAGTLARVILPAAVEAEPWQAS